MKQKILVVELGNKDYLALMATNHGQWGSGPSEDAAIGNLIMRYPEPFSVEIKSSTSPKAKRPIDAPMPEVGTGAIEAHNR